MNRPVERDTAGLKAEPGRSLWRGLISLAILVAMVVGLLLAVPGLHGVAHAVGDMSAGWLAVAVVLEILSCLGYVLAFLQVFDRAPLRFGARVALSELAFGAAVSLGGAGSVAVGAWLLVERGGEPTRIAERSAVLFLLTSAINVITLDARRARAVRRHPAGTEQSAAELRARDRSASIVLVFFLLLPRYSERLARRSRSPGRVRTLLIETAARRSASPSRCCSRATGGSSARSRFLWCDIAVLAACFAAAGSVPPLATIVLAYQIGYLSNLIPVPGEHRRPRRQHGRDVRALRRRRRPWRPPQPSSTTRSRSGSRRCGAPAAFVILRRTRDHPIKLRPPREVRRRLRREARERRASRD